ncbi:MAG TPA: ABC transporter permease, partial [Gemmatimonadaceae bacterium]|nr:ABC transporter permease [Gemmatimonadaceae bacterium]
MTPRWRTGIRRVLGIVVRRRDLIQRDADDELASLLEARVDQLIAGGMSPTDAQAEAVRRIGGSVEIARTDLRHSAERRERVMSIREWFDDLSMDVRYAFRGLRREPVFSGFVILTLALGIGANAAMFGIVDKLLLQGPAQVRDVNRVVRVFWTMRLPTGVEQTSAEFDTRIYANIQADTTAFSGLALYTTAVRLVRIGEDNSARLVSSAYATANLMSVLESNPETGRFFTMDEQENVSSVIVLGYELWQSDFGGDQKIVG